MLWHEDKRRVLLFNSLLAAIVGSKSWRASPHAARNSILLRNTCESKLEKNMQEEHREWNLNVSQFVRLFLFLIVLASAQ